MKKTIREIYNDVEKTSKSDLSYDSYCVVLEALQKKYEHGMLVESIQSDNELVYWVHAVLENQNSVHENIFSNFAAAIQKAKEQVVETGNTLMTKALSITEKFMKTFGQTFEALKRFAAKVSDKLDDLFVLVRDKVFYDAIIYLKNMAVKTGVTLTKMYQKYNASHKELSHLVFGKIDASPLGIAIKNGIKSLQDYLDAHPSLKLALGPVVAYVLYYIWTKMVFKAELLYDFDWTMNWNALFGSYDLVQIFAGESGLEFLTWFTLGNLGFPSASWLDGDLAAIFGGWGNHILAGLVTFLFYLYDKKPELFDNPILREIQKQVCGRNEQANMPRNIEAIKNYAIMNKIYIQRKGPTCSMSGGASAPEHPGLEQAPQPT